MRLILAALVLAAPALAEAPAAPSVQVQVAALAELYAGSRQHVEVLTLRAVAAEQAVADLQRRLAEAEAKLKPAEEPH